MANIGTTNVPAITWGANGPVIPSGPAVLAGVQADYDVAFNVSFNFSPSTPQGQMTGTMAATISYFYQLWAYYTNQIDPAFAAGRMQDAIARIYFLERNPAEPTAVECTCVGLSGVVIPAGALAVATDGNLYRCAQEGTIPDGGSITLSFAAILSGPISCPAGTLTKIYQAIPGWDSVTNPSDGVTGRSVESRADFEARRAASVAANSIGALPSVQGAVLSVANVLDAYVAENSTGSPVTIRGVSVPAHAIYVSVSGGASADVAQAIWSKKAPGCATAGNTAVVVTDNNAGYSPPYPTYTINFEIPTPLAILFAVSIQNSGLVPSDAAQQIQTAIIAAFNGEDGGTRARIGSTIYASRFMSSVISLGAWAQLISLKVGSTNTPLATFTASIAGTNMTVSAVASGVLAVGQTIAGSGIPAGVTILSQSSGSAGSTGVYVISAPLTISSETVVSAKATDTDVEVNLNQVPTIAASNIIVSVV